MHTLQDLRPTAHKTYVLDHGPAIMTKCLKRLQLVTATVVVGGTGYTYHSTDTFKG